MGDGALTAELLPLPELAALQARWRALEELAPANVFTSWTWIGSWLRATGARPELLAVRDGSGTDVALALIGRSREKRLLGRVAVLRLNEAGDATADRVFIEYNAPLCRAGEEMAAAKAIAMALASRPDWRALRLSGVVPGSLVLKAVPARRRVLIDRSPVYMVDLAAVRETQGDYLSLLSANSRAQIRRSARDHGDGEPKVEVAGDMLVVQAWLDEMARLNQGRHAHNAWEEPVFRAFAAELAWAGLADGSVELMRVRIGEALVGYLLNLRSAGRVMNYQSAFAEPASAKAKPGLMSHAAAVRHYAAEGLAVYSLLAGRDRYKQSLSTGAETLEWWSLERFSPALEVEYWLRKLLRRRRAG